MDSSVRFKIKKHWILLLLTVFIKLLFLQQGNTSSEKKGILEGLDRDELIRKCKGLLVIAQKAKKAKDGLYTEFM